MINVLPESNWIGIKDLNMLQNKQNFIHQKSKLEWRYSWYSLSLDVLVKVHRWLNSDDKLLWKLLFNAWSYRSWPKYGWSQMRAFKAVTKAALGKILYSLRKRSILFFSEGYVKMIVKCKFGIWYYSNKFFKNLFAKSLYC